MFFDPPLPRFLIILFITVYHLREEPPDDEFADILNQMADYLYDEAEIDSLGGQLGILHGDIERALHDQCEVQPCYQ